MMEAFKNYVFFLFKFTSFTSVSELASANCDLMLQFASHTPTSLALLISLCHLWSDHFTSPFISYYSDTTESSLMLLLPLHQKRSSDEGRYSGQYINTLKSFKRPGNSSKAQMREHSFKHQYIGQIGHNISTMILFLLLLTLSYHPTYSICRF